jgi:hypothetical protein
MEMGKGKGYRVLRFTGWLTPSATEHASWALSMRWHCPHPSRRTDDQPTLCITLTPVTGPGRMHDQGRKARDGETQFQTVVETMREKTCLLT